MKFDLKELPTKLSPIFEAIKSYVVVIFVIVIGLMYAFLILRVNQLAQSEPDDDAVMQQFETTTRPRIDDESATKLEALEDQNVQAQTLFNQARNNPFSE